MTLAHPLDRTLNMTLDRRNNPDLRRILTQAALVAALAGAGLAGCASVTPFDRRIDSSSPVSGDVATASAQTEPWPHWSTFPKAPTDVPAPADIRKNAETLGQDQAALLAAAAALPWRLRDSAQFAVAQRALIRSDLAAPAPAGAAENTRAYGERLKVLATPPEPAK